MQLVFAGVEGYAASIGISGTAVGSLIGSIGVVWAGVVVAFADVTGIGHDAGKFMESIQDASKGTGDITKSDHTVIRSSQGRNVNTAINDVQRARPADILIQDDGHWVIRGQNGRIHILEPDGEIVTTMDKVTNSNVQQRIASGRWSPLTLGEEELFKQLFSKYVNWDWL